jgi:hypothetical protein
VKLGRRGLALALVRDLRDHRAPVSEEELADFQTDVLAGFVLARASAGLADSPIRNDTGHLQLIRDWFGRPLWEMQPDDADAYFDTANRHVLLSRISALGTRPVSPDYLDKHQPRGISLEYIRRDRILQEALATGADPLHLALVFNIDHTNAMAYANAARNLLSSPAEKPGCVSPLEISTGADAEGGRYGR